MDDTRVPPGPKEPSYSVSEAAKACGVYRGTVRRWALKGLIDHWVTPTGRFRIPESQLARITEIRRAA